jgi:ferric-dicitrate binding protein FerR (iron transport regulator)
MKNDDWDDLIQRHLAGIATMEESARLEQALEGDAKLRALYLDYANLDLALEATAKADTALQEAQLSPVATPSFNRWSWLSLGAIAAALVMGVFVFVSEKPRVVEAQKPAAVEPGIVRVIHVEGEAWVDGERALADGDELYAAGNVSMTNGFIELSYRDSGVHLIANAPLSLRLDDPMQLFVQEGGLKFVVPPQGKGFVVLTEDQEIVDLGTSFILKAKQEKSTVVVLEGQISVGKRSGDAERLIMSKGDFAVFKRGVETGKRTPAWTDARDLPEIELRVTEPGPASLRGKILGQSAQPLPGEGSEVDVIGRQFVPLIQSGFQDQSGLELLPTGAPLRFAGIAGAFQTLPKRTGLELETVQHGWMTWYRGRVVPPRKGRYRFWGSADNHLLVAVDGKPVFEASRDSSFSEIGIPRTDNPALPCLIARAGFAHGPWVVSKGEALQLDILFGEIGGNPENGVLFTSGLLLIEWEGEAYEETSWGQPRWPVFMTEAPNAAEVAGLKSLRRHLESKMMGSFSVAPDAIWKVNNEKVARQ